MHATVHLPPSVPSLLLLLLLRPPPPPTAPPHPAIRHPFFVDPFSPLLDTLHRHRRGRRPRRRRRRRPRRSNARAECQLFLSPCPLPPCRLFSSLLFPSVFRAPIRLSGSLPLPRRVTGGAGRARTLFQSMIVIVGRGWVGRGSGTE